MQITVSKVISLQERWMRWLKMGAPLLYVSWETIAEIYYRLILDEV